MATWVVMAASYEARAFGVRSAMPVVEAHRLCPDLLAVEPRGEAYAEASRELFEVFDAASPQVEHHGLEEAFLEGPPELGETLRRRVRDEVGLPVTVGVGSTKIAAKMASRAAKPDGLRVLAAEDERGFLDGHRVERLWGIGQATATKLHARWDRDRRRRRGARRARARRAARARQWPPRACAGQQSRPDAGGARRAAALVRVDALAGP